MPAFEQLTHTVTPNKQATMQGFHVAFRLFGVVAKINSGLKPGTTPVDVQTNE
jgi:hypothetical protein